MSYRRSLRPLGLSLAAVLGLMALTAASAQAGWLVLHGADPIELHQNESVLVADHTDFTLLVAGKNLELLCHDVTGKDVLLTGLTLMTGLLVYNECLAFTMTPLTRVKNCDPINQPIELGFKAHLFLHNGKNYISLGPTTPGGVLAVIEFSELCALTETSEVTGKLVLECGHLNAGSFLLLDCGEHQVTHLLRPASSALFPSDVLKVGENAAIGHGILSATLSGAHAGDSWGGDI